MNLVSKDKNEALQPGSLHIRGLCKLSRSKTKQYIVTKTHRFLPMLIPVDVFETRWSTRRCFQVLKQNHCVRPDSRFTKTKPKVITDGWYSTGWIIHKTQYKMKRLFQRCVTSLKSWVLSIQSPSIHIEISNMSCCLLLDEIKTPLYLLYFKPPGG